MAKIKIFHAFNGFIYAPVFLAHELQLFPKDTELHYAGNDDEAITSILDQSDPDVIPFAICDPLSSEKLNRIVSHRPDDLCVVATLIDTIPLWVYNPDPNVIAVDNEQKLQRYRPQLKKIVTYPVPALAGDVLHGAHVLRCRLCMARTGSAVELTC